MTNIKTHKGSCHCGHLRFEVELDASQGSRCNCTICARMGAVGQNVKPAAFRALTDEATLASYEWGHKVAKKYFCPRCGIHGYSRGHLAEIGGDFVSINMNCLEDVDLAQVKIVYWDGRNDNWHAGTRETPWPVVATRRA